MGRRERAATGAADDHQEGDHGAVCFVNYTASFPVPALFFVLKPTPPGVDIFS